MVTRFVSAVVLVAFALVAGGALGEPSDLLLRKTYSLNGDWRVIVDPIDHGSIDYRSRRRDLFVRDPADNGRFDLVEFAWDDANTLRVPGDWNSQDERLFFYEGAVWYRKTFELASSGWEEGERLWLCFGGANRETTVWVNGELVGGNDVGFTGFSFDVTGVVREGENVIVARVDNRRAFEAVPGELFDWWNYGGITRDVWLATSPESYIEDWRAWLDGGVVRVRARVRGVDAEAHVRGRAQRESPQLHVIVSDDDAVGDGRIVAVGSAVVGGEDEFEVALEHRRGVERWSPERPKRYTVSVGFTLPATGAIDSVSDAVGFREIATRGGEVLLNGEQVFLRGVSIHEEAPLRGGRAVSEEDARVLLGWAKELGCNFVRLAHYTHNEHVVRVADEMGLMVWAEIPVYWILDFENPETLAMAERHLEGMIGRDRNRGSVVIWSIGNETGDAPEVTRFRRALGEYVKERDPTRLLSAAMFARQVRERPGHEAEGSAGARLTKLVVDDPFGEIADVLAINLYVGWYHDRPDEIGGVEVELGWDKPFMLSEIGVGVKQGLRGARENRWTEEYGVWLYEETLGWAEGVPNLAGMSPWILQDFRSPRRPRYGIQDWYNRKGLISESGLRKDVFGVLQAWYGRVEAEGIGGIAGSETP